MADTTTPAGSGSKPASTDTTTTTTTQTSTSGGGSGASGGDSGAAAAAKLPLADSPPASDPVPFAEAHVDPVRNASDQQSAGAMTAAADPEIDTDAIARMGYQVSQFDTTSGDSVLKSLANPPAAALRAQQAVDAANADRTGAATDTTGTDAATKGSGSTADSTASTAPATDATTK